MVTLFIYEFSVLILYFFRKYFPFFTHELLILEIYLTKIKISNIFELLNLRLLYLVVNFWR